MNFVKLIYDGRHYGYRGGSNLEMDILGCFLSSDVGCSSSSSHKNWVPDDRSGSLYSNITFVEKEDGCIYLIDLYSEEDVPTKLKLSVPQFLQLLDNWSENVCKLRPQEVVIKHENDQFIIETND
ncbi:MAG TPA: hypothetical protein VGT41_01125 [Candidatus Babeliales bacterium]|nr:hypothetical protein [Candidatus Babeliales bacterium]